MPTQLDLLRNASRHADDAVRDMRDLRRRVQREIERQLRRLANRRGEVDARVRLRSLLSIRAAVIDVTAVMGAAATMSVLERRSQRAAEDAVRLLRERIEASSAVFEDAFIPDAASMVARVVSGFSPRLVQVFNLADDSLRRAVNAGSLADMPVDDLVRDVVGVAASTFARAEAIVDTAVMSIARDFNVATVDRVNARLGRDFFVLGYTGPVDKLTRPFCRHLLTATSRYFTTDAIDALDNGQGLPVRQSCGGYRCRHLWAPRTATSLRKAGIEIVGADDVAAINAAWRAGGR